MAKANTIELNGKVYDARTGRPIGSDEKKIIKNAVKKRPKQQSVGVVDGFQAPRKRTGTNAATASKKASKRSSMNSIKRRPKQSTTLYRGVLKKPLAASMPAKNSTPKVQSTALKAAKNPALERAKKIPQNPLVSRFGNVAQTVEKKSAAKTSVTTPEKTKSPEPTTKATPLHETLKRTTPAPSKKSKGAKKQARKKSKVVGIGSAVLAGCLLAAYVAYLNVPSVSMRVAAHRAGFDATLPTYRPTGYSFRGPIQHHPGQVTIHFQGSDAEKSFSLAQQKTSWDSTALLENYVAEHTTQYVTYQDRGLTIYIFDGSNAAWVSGGKMYTIDTENAQLDTDQILKLATSM